MSNPSSADGVAKDGTSGGAPTPVRMWSVVFNLLQSCMGVGILSLAATFQYCGIAGGIVTLVCSGALSYYTTHVLAHSMVISGTESFEALGQWCFGRAGQVVVQLTLLGNALLALICFLVPLKHYFYDVLKQVLSRAAFDNFNDHAGSPNLCLAILLGAVILPLSMMRKIDSLWFTSLLGFFIQVYFTVMSVGYFGGHADQALEDRVCAEIQNEQAGGSASDAAAAFAPPLSLAGALVDAAARAVEDANTTAPAAPDFPTEAVKYIGSDFSLFCQSISIIACSFCCQVSVFPIYRELRAADTAPTSVYKLMTSAKIAMSIACLVYVVAAGAGYLMYRDLSDRASSILACYSPSNPAVIICYFGMSCVLMFAFPLMLISVRYCLATFIYSHETLNAGPIKLSVHTLLTLAIIGFVTAIALAIDRLTIVLSIGGGIVVPFFGYVLPAVMYTRVLLLKRDEEAARLLHERVETGDARAQTEHEQYIAALAQRSLKAAYAGVAVGTTVWVACMYGSISGAV